MSFPPGSDMILCINCTLETRDAIRASGDDVSSD